MAKFLLFATLLAGLFVWSAYARPPPGADTTGAEFLWWNCQLDKAGNSCCSEADGHVLADTDWRNGDTGVYQIRVQGRWFNVPPDAVISEARRCGPEPLLEHRAMAKAWYTMYWSDEGTVLDLHVRCFEAGTLY